jgi:hypothetical protein
VLCSAERHDNVLLHVRKSADADEELQPPPPPAPAQTAPSSAAAPASAVASLSAAAAAAAAAQPVATDAQAPSPAALDFVAEPVSGSLGILLTLQVTYACLHFPVDSLAPRRRRYLQL